MHLQLKLGSQDSDIRKPHTVRLRKLQAAGQIYDGHRPVLLMVVNFILQAEQTSQLVCEDQQSTERHRLRPGTFASQTGVW